MDLEARLASAKMLLEQLRARAGAEPTTPAAKRATPKKTGRAVSVPPVSVAKTSEKPYPAEPVEKTPLPADAAERIAALSAALVSGGKGVDRAVRARHRDAIRAAVTSLVNAQREGGLLL